MRVTWPWHYQDRYPTHPLQKPKCDTDVVVCSELKYANDCKLNVNSNVLTISNCDRGNQYLPSHLLLFAFSIRITLFFSEKSLQIQRIIWLCKTLMSCSMFILSFSFSEADQYYVK